MSNKVPEGWFKGIVGDAIMSADGGVSVNSDNRPALSNECGVLKTSSLADGRFVPGENKVILPKDRERARVQPRKNHILFSRMNTPMLVGQSGFVDKDYNNLFLPDRLWQLKIRKTFNPRWFSYYLRSEALTKAISDSATGTSNSMKNISKPNLMSIPLFYPPLPEQKKIAAILSSVDEVIEKTRAQIDKLKDLKTGMMQELLTKGIGHTEFKDSPVGRIPAAWDVVDYASVVRVVMTSFTLDDDERYCPVVVRRRHMGVETRETKPGRKILVKSQYRVTPGTFLISKRQIYHGSCGLVPKNISEKAIISKEYLALETTNALDIRFLDYFSHTDIFQQQIIRTTYGIDVEKFVFKDQWWMKELIPLPSKDEQKRVCDALDSLGSEISNKEKYLTQFESLKKALMQDLLTGKVRVNVDARELADA